MTISQDRLRAPFRAIGSLRIDDCRAAVVAAAICYGDPPEAVLLAHGTDNERLRRAYAPAAIALAIWNDCPVNTACAALGINYRGVLNARRLGGSWFDAAQAAVMTALEDRIFKPRPEAGSGPVSVSRKPVAAPACGQRGGVRDPDFVPPERRDYGRKILGQVPGAGRNVRGYQDRRCREVKVSADILRWVAPAARKGESVASLAEMFGIEPEALRLALIADGIIAGVMP